jgi:hypothetical protein
VIRAAAMALALVVLAGCGSTRENARAVVQAQQATEASVRILTAREVADALAKLSPEDRAKIEAPIRAALALLRSAHQSLSAPAALLGQGQPVDVPTSVEQAVAAPEAFVAAAAVQSGRAEVEAQARLADAAFWRGLVTAVGGASWEDLLASVLKATPFAAPAAGLLVFLQRARAQAAKLRDAVAEGARLTDAVEKREPAEKVAECKTRARKAQERAGVHDHVQRARGKA